MRRVNLIPMAGLGQRFIDSGYVVPKPLIEIDGVPMAVRAAKCLPEADEFIFICRQDHIDEYAIDKILRNHLPNSIVLSVDRMTEGQASTCLIAKEILRGDDQLTIGACDCAIEFNRSKYNKLMSSVDVVVWTFRNNPSVESNPQAYGWVLTGAKEQAISISCKVPISEQPTNDHAIAGVFSFLRADTFIRCAESIIRKKRRVRGEYYVDTVADECLIFDYRVIVMEIERYICWGTPQDVKNYHAGC